MTDKTEAATARTEMRCVRCNGFSSTRVCWHCSNLPDAIAYLRVAELEAELASERLARMAAEGELNYLRRPLPADQNEQSYRLKMYSAIISLFRERRIAVEGPLVDYVQSQIERAEQAEQSLALERAARERAKAALLSIKKIGCMNRGDDNMWCKDGVHSIYCPAGMAIKALAQEGGKP